jgi:hypothetical protein
MGKSLRDQIFSNINLKETDELVDIWITNDRTEWSDTAFDVVEEILEQRLDELPVQNVPIFGHQKQIKIVSTTSNNEDKTSRNAKAAFIIGLLAPLGAICGSIVAVIGLVGEFLPVVIFGLAIPFLICLVGVAFGIFGIKSKQRVTAIIGIVLSGLTLYYYLDIFFIPLFRGE